MTENKPKKLTLKRTTLAKLTVKTGLKAGWITTFTTKINHNLNRA